MPNPILSVSLYPDVPALPGVPQLVRPPSIVSLFSGLTADTITVTSDTTLADASGGLTSGTSMMAALTDASNIEPTWGIFDDSLNQVISPDSILNFHNDNNWRVSTFPVEQGQFASYNKVLLPFEIVVRMVKGGSINDRTDFINQIAKIAGDTNQYTILTPEIGYQNCNITRYEVTRITTSGAYFLAEVDVFFIQIVETTPVYSTSAAATQDAQNPSAQGATNQGTVNPQPPSPAAAAAAQEAISGPN